MLALYHAGLSTCSKKVRLCLAEKGLAYKSHYLRLRLFEHHRPEYLAINPNGVVPTLVHDGRAIIESTVINEYVDEVFVEPSLRPADPYELATMRVWTKFVDEFAFSSIIVPTWARSFGRIGETITDEDLAAALDRVPLQERRDRWRKIARGGFETSEFEAAREKMATVIQRTEAALSRQPWLAGSSYSLADISMVPYVERIADFRPDLVCAESNPATTDWLSRMMRRAAVVATFTPSAEAPSLGWTSAAA